MATGALTAYAAGELIKHVFRTGSFTKPTDLYVALYKENGDELSGTGYARVACGPGDASWDAPAATGKTANSVEIEFGEPQADWGRATHFGICLASTGGDVLVKAELTAAKNINDGDPAPKFPVGALTFEFTECP